MTRYTLVAAMALAAVLTAPSTALAGGWATVGLSSLPDGAGPGEEWVVDLTILQHGRTPLEGVKPRVLIRPADGGREETFAATPTGRQGVYRAQVMFPSAGEWTYLVDDGFTQVHELGSVRIGAGSGAATPPPPPTRANPSPPDDGVTLAGALGIAAAAGLLAALAAAALRRRDEARPATE
jgi:hypothetical protein